MAPWMSAAEIANALGVTVRTIKSYFAAPKDIRVGFAALGVLSTIPESDLDRLAALPQDQFVVALPELGGDEWSRRWRARERVPEHGSAGCNPIRDEHAVEKVRF